MATEEEHEIDWIYFELNGCKLRIDRNDSNNLQKWRDTWKGRPIKNPYWKQVSLTTSSGYIQCNFNHKKYLHHRIVYYAYNPDWDFHDGSKNNFIDHMDQNKTNNHISNLRVVTNAQNKQNIKAKGCYYRKQCKKWQAEVVVNNKYIYLGYYDTEEEAREAYLKAKREHHPFFHES